MTSLMLGTPKTNQFGEGYISTQQGHFSKFYIMSVSALATVDSGSDMTS